MFHVNIIIQEGRVMLCRGSEEGKRWVRVKGIRRACKGGNGGQSVSREEGWKSNSMNEMKGRRWEQGRQGSGRPDTPAPIPSEYSCSSAALQVTHVRKHRRQCGLHVGHAPYNTVKSRSLWKQVLG